MLTLRTRAGAGQRPGAPGCRDARRIGMTSIGDYLIWLSLALVAVLVLVELFRGAKVLTLLQFALILTVAAIPVAMPAVLSVTMAVGAVALSKMKAIVTRLESIEEMAGMDVLCSDKTGTLTQNKLTLAAPVPAAGTGPAEVILAAALASRPGTTDAIDKAVIAGAGGQDALAGYAQARFTPFDPVSKRTEADITGASGSFSVTKGAPQVVLGLCGDDGASAGLDRAAAAVTELAGRGYRTLAKLWLHLDIAQIQSLIFLKLAVAGHLSHGGPTRQRFLRRLQEHLHPGA